MRADVALPVLRPTTTRGAAPRHRRRSTEGGAWRLLAPAFAIEVVFVLLPIGICLWNSFHRMDFLERTAFVGLDNYLAVVTSGYFLRSLGVTLTFSVFALVFTFGLGFALAVFLERDSRLNVFGRAVVLVPYVISMLVGSLLLRWLILPDAGLLSLALAGLGFGEVSILADPTKAMAALVANAVWRDCAFATILLMAGLKSVPLQIYQAASIDGASRWYQFRRITVPLLKIPIQITLARLLIHFVNAVTFPLVLTNGGPNGATETMGLALYRLGFANFQLSEANALAIMVLLFNLALVYLLFRVTRARRSG